MELTVKIIGKDISLEKKTFTVYSVLTDKAKWYRVSGEVVGTEFEKHEGKVAVINVVRKYDKKFIKADGEETSFPTLVVDSISSPTPAQEKKFNDALQKINDLTLQDI